MNSNYNHLELVPLIYDVATQPEGWVDLLDVLPDVVNAKSSAIVVSERSVPTGELMSHFGVVGRQLDSEKIAAYNREFMHYEIAYGERVVASEAGTLVVDPAFEDRAAIIQRPDVAFSIANFDIVDRFAVKLNDEAAWSDILTFQYPSSRGNVSTEEFARLQPLITSLAQSVSQMRMFDAIRKRYNAVFSVLNRLDIALLILDESCRIIVKNDSADQLIDASPHLKMSPHGTLMAINSQIQSQIKQAVLAAVATAKGVGLSAKQLVALGDDLSHNNILFEITPLSDASAEIESGFRGAMVLVVDPNRPIPVPIDTIKLLYGLTNSEAQVADLLSNGHSYDTVAEARSVQRETVKSQVASLYQKMRTNSRAGLVRRILSISLPFKDD